jgi:hypothetical protein
MPGVQFGTQIDMNGFKVTEVAPGTAPTDAVNVSQLTANAPQGFAQDVGNGVATSFNLVHGFNLPNKEDFIAKVTRNSDGIEFMVEVASVDVNTISVTFGVAPASNAYRVSVVPVP